jgi:hypothetical protein
MSNTTLMETMIDACYSKRQKGEGRRQKGRVEYGGVSVGLAALPLVTTAIVSRVISACWRLQ